MKPEISFRLHMMAVTLQSYLKTRGRLPLSDAEAGSFAWKIMLRQVLVTTIFRGIEYAVLACCALAAATLLGLDPLRGTAALLVIRFLIVGMSVKNSAEAARHKVVKATLDEALAKSKPNPEAPPSIASALENLIKGIETAKNQEKP